MHKVWDKTSLTLYDNNAPYEKAGGIIEGSLGCYLIGVATAAGIGGEKTQPNWDAQDSLYDYWVVEYCDTVMTSFIEIAGDVRYSIYPNPTAREVSIMLQRDGLREADFTLTSPSGQIIYQSTETDLASTYTKILDLGTLPSGLYILSLTVDGLRIVRKVMKE